MNEEIRMEAMENENVEVETTETQEVTDYSGKGNLGRVILGAGLVAVAGGVGYVLKNKDKLKEKHARRKYEKLEKKAAKMGLGLYDMNEEVFDEAEGCVEEESGEKE